MKNANRLKIALQKKGRLFNESHNLLDHCGLDVNNYNNALLYHCKNIPIDLLFVRDDDIPILVANKICDIGIVGENVVYEKFSDLSNLRTSDLTLQEKNLRMPLAINNPTVSNVNFKGLDQISISQKTDFAIFTNEDANFYDKEPEKKSPLYVVKKLGFGYCQLAIAIPQDQDFSFPNSMNNKRIATTYPNLLQNFLTKHQINATIVPLSGSVEIAPRLEIADMICDLVSSGQTLEANFLKPVTTLLSSQAILISSEKSFPSAKQAIFDLLLCRIEGVLQAQSRKYILFHAPRSALPAITQLLPGTETPTILPLNHCEDKVAVHVVSAEAVFWDTLEKLKQVGASSILVLPIEKMLG